MIISYAWLSSPLLPDEIVYLSQSQVNPHSLDTLSQYEPLSRNYVPCERVYGPLNCWAPPSRCGAVEAYKIHCTWFTRGDQRAVEKSAKLFMLKHDDDIAEHVGERGRDLQMRL
ncbi:hypothetical protein SCLCIDRAFT_405738 [Scleroderma citrinum Foug A]|uniref:Uncharacterized protein n=1 Tax=Scleroderma citrinum Foug A TaxID=1036808 RepID=A0A0C3CZL0_9AGAM|nr:hypothetical protein SCLCIDRAFT_405738 [Scleroderma citrinum Foug A]